MLSSGEASSAIQASLVEFGDETIRLEHALGRILKEQVVAERDQPPFDRVMMDGISLKYAAFAGGQRAFKIAGTQHAGDPVMRMPSADACIETMTGAMLPRGCDCIVPVERLAVSGRTATIDDDYAAEQRRFIHPQGSDHKAGDVLLQVGREISPLDVAVIASCGMANVVVGRKPKVRVISTGNELVAPGQAIEPHQIRLSNGPALVAMLSQAGFDDCAHEQLSDDRHALKASFERHLAEADVMVLSGGVSMGKADFVPEVLAGLGVEQIFHRITQRPGKPMWFGVGPEEQAVFALPGNPVSSMVCCRHYVLPALLRASGRAEPAVQMAALAEAVNFAPALTLFLPVRTTVSAEGRILAVPVPTNTSGDFASLSGTDGYVELVCEEASFAAGRSVPLYRWSRP